MGVKTKNHEAMNVSTIVSDRAAEFARANFAYLDLDLRYLFVSKQYEELVGIPRERLVGRQIRELVDEESFALQKPHFEIAQSGRATSFETTLPGNSGSMRRLTCHVWPDVGSDGNVHGLYLLDHEHAETERIKGEMLAREGHFRRVLEKANIIPWEANPQTWQFTYVGSQAECILGYPLDQWYEEDFWTSTILPEDREFAINFCETSSKTLSDFEFQYRMVKADGDVIWLRDIVNVDIEDGVPQTLRGFMIDITAAKQLEETLKHDHDVLAESLEQQHEELIGTIQKSEHAQLALRKAGDARARAVLNARRIHKYLDAAPDPIVLADEAGIIVFASERLERLFGYRAEEVVGSDMEVLIPKRLRRRHPTPSHRARRSRCCGRRAIRRWLRDSSLGRSST